ncbi:ATP-binding protein [Candidatus Margulisiibacteriota bacterium]
MKTPLEFKLEIPASKQCLSSARLAISGLANQADFSVQEIQEIKKAFSEACRIAIDNAYLEQKNDSKLAIHCQVNKNKLTLAVRNKGIEIDIKKSRHAH